MHGLVKIIPKNKYHSYNPHTMSVPMTYNNMSEVSFFFKGWFSPELQWKTRGAKTFLSHHKNSYNKQRQ